MNSSRITIERITFEASRWEIALLEIGTCDTIAANRLLDACAEVGIPALDSLAIAYSQEKHLEVAQNGTPKSSKIRAFQH